MNQPGFASNMMRGQPMMGMPQGPPLQQQPGQPPSIIHQVVAQMRNHMNTQPPSWRHDVSLQDRLSHVNQIVTAIKLSKPDLQANQAFQVYGTAAQREKEAIMNAPDRNAYTNSIRQILSGFHSQRQAQANNQPLGPAQVPNGMHPGRPGQPMHAGQGMPNGQSIPQAFNPQLRTPMQASPIPISGQSSSMGAGMPGAIAPQMQPQLSEQPQGPGQPMGQQQNQGMNFNKQIPSDLVSRVANALKEQQPANPAVINNYWASLPPDRRMIYQSQGLDATSFYYSMEARKHLQQQAVNQNMQGRPGQMPNNGQNPALTPGRQFQQPGLQQPMLNGQQRLGGSFPNSDMDLNQFLSQQAEAMQSANAGQTVVPPSNNISMGNLVGMGQNTGFQPQNIPGGQMTPSGMIRAPGAMNPQTSQMQVQVQQAQQNQRLAQLNQNRNQAMNIAGAMSTQGSMPLLTASIAAPQHPGGPPRPQSTTGMGQPQGTMGNMGLQGQRPQGMAGPMGPQGLRPGVMQSRESRIPPNLPPQIRQQLLNVDDQMFEGHLQRVLAMINHNQMRNHPGAVPNASQVNGMIGQPGMQRPPQPGQQVPLPTGVVHQPQGGGLLQNPQIAELIRSLDPTDFPPSILAANNIPPPPNGVKTWGQLKQWLTQNRQLIPDLNLQKLIAAQVQSANRRGIGAPGLGNVPQKPGMQQMQGPQGAMQIGRPMPNQMNIPVTAQEIMIFRSRLNDPTKTDEEIRQMVIQFKSRQQPQPNQMAMPHMAPFAMKQAMHQPGNRHQILQQQGGPMGQMPPNAAHMAMSNKPPQPNQQAAHSSPVQPQKMLKRPSSDGEDPQRQSMTTPNPQSAAVPSSQQRQTLTPQMNARQSAAPNQAPNQASNQAIGRAPLTPEQVKQIFIKLFNDAKEQFKSPQVQPMTPEKRSQYLSILQSHHEKLPKMDLSLRQLYMMRRNEDELRRWIMDRYALGIQVDFQSRPPNLKNVVCLDLEQFKIIVERLSALVSQAEALQQKVNSSQMQATPRMDGKAAPNVSQSPKQANGTATAQSQRRTSAKAPPAPTVGPGQNTFQFPTIPPGVQSPSGIPAYFEGAKSIDPKMPQQPFKKQKRGPSAASPSQTSGTTLSPQLTKSATTPKEQASSVTTSHVIDQPKPKPFRCDQSNCTLGSKGFDTQAQLDDHKATMHIPFPDDPMNFAIEQITGALGVQVDEETKMAVSDHDKTSSSKTVTKVSTPRDDSPPSAQPMGRSATQPGVKTSPSFSLLKAPKETKMPGPTSAPKEIKDGVSGDDSTKTLMNTSIVSPISMASIFDIDAFREPQIGSVPSTLDSSPSALTPSSSRDSSSSGTRERSSDILEGDKLKVTVAVDPASSDLGLGLGDIGSDSLTLFSVDGLTELQHGDFSDMGIFPTSLDADDIWANDSSKPSFMDTWMTGDADDKLLDLNWENLGSSMDDFDKMLL